MNLALEISEKVKRLDEESQKLILGIVVRFLNDGYDDFLTEEDLKDIAIAREERAKGEVYSFSDIEKGLI